MELGDPPAFFPNSGMAGITEIIKINDINNVDIALLKFGKSLFLR